MGKTNFEAPKVVNSGEFLFPPKVAVKVAAVRHAVPTNARRVSNATKSTTIASTIDVKAELLVHSHFQPFTFSIVPAFDAFR
jgi:hypothetical protein